MSDMPLKAGLDIHWHYSGEAKVSSLGEGWRYWHHGHGPVRTISCEIDDQEVTLEEFMEIATKVVDDLEVRFNQAIFEHIQKKKGL